MADVYVPPGGPPQSPPPGRHVLEAVGEENIRRLLSIHYSHLEKSPIRRMFPEDMEAASQKAADFFIQAMGGPPYYSQKYGPPRMRARHMPFEITEEGRKVWLDCFKAAMDELPFPAEHRAEFQGFLDSFSSWMVNAT